MRRTQNRFDHCYILVDWKKINLLANAVYITIKYIRINKKNKKKKEILPFWNRQSKAILPGSGKSENEKRKTDGREKEGERGERVEEEKERKKERGWNTECGWKEAYWELSVNRSKMLKRLDGPDERALGKMNNGDRRRSRNGAEVI